MASGDFLPYTPSETQSLRLKINDLEQRVLELESLINTYRAGSERDDRHLYHMYEGFHL